MINIVIEDLKINGPSIVRTIIVTQFPCNLPALAPALAPAARLGINKFSRLIFVMMNGPPRAPAPETSAVTVAVSGTTVVTSNPALVSLHYCVAIFSCCLLVRRQWRFFM